MRDGEVLMGRRASAHRFVPGHFVFPGGVLDRGDLHAPARAELRPAVSALLEQDGHRGRAFAVAAVRETYEETGLVLGELTDGNLLPALDRLQYVMRAITPPASPIRYHARFFLANAADLSGRLQGNGELLDLAWRPIAECLRLPIVDVTEHLLRQLGKGFHRGRARKAPLFCFRNGIARLL